ncbi:MAG: iron chelate uptake ABC transporter family permease subunit, partial [Marinomonas gallaica]
MPFKLLNGVMSRHPFLFVVFTATILLVAITMGVSIGETSIDFTTVIQAVANGAFGADYPIHPIDQGVIWNYRLTRTLVAACCGAALAVTGLVLQSLLRNALADPYLLGISAGASTGAVMVTIAGIGIGVLSMSFGALIGAMLAFGFVMLLSALA